MEMNDSFKVYNYAQAVFYFSLFKWFDCIYFIIFFNSVLNFVVYFLHTQELSLENDQTCLHQVAQAIVMLEDIYGRIDHVSGKGHAVKQVWDMVTKISLEQRRPGSKANRNYSTIDHLILIDRSVDLLTPMVTQLTYEGLIDELFGIDFCAYL